MGIMIAYHGHNNDYDNLVYNVHKNVGVHYTQQNTVLSNVFVLHVKINWLNNLMCILIIYCCIENHLKVYWLQTTAIICVLVSLQFGQGSEGSSSLLYTLSSQTHYPYVLSNRCECI